METTSVSYVKENYKQITFWLIVAALAVWIFGATTKP